MPLDLENVDAGEVPFKQFSNKVWTKLRAGFGVNRMRFFDIYGHLRASYYSDGYDPGFSYETEFRALRKLIFRRLVTENGKNQFLSLSGDLIRKLRKVEKGSLPRTMYRILAAEYADLIELTASELDIFVKGQRKGSDYFRYFRNTSPQEARLMKLKRDDPAAYRTIQKQKGIVQEAEDRIKAHIESQGLTPKRVRRSGNLYWSALTETGERTIFFTDKETGAIQGQDDESFKADLKKNRRERAMLTKSFFTDEELDSFRSVPDSVIDQALARQKVKYVAITDDKAKVDGVTRIYPTIEWAGEKVVADGRFKGIHVDDLVNEAGRQIEGTAYNYDFKTGRPQKLQVKNPDGSPNVRATREPYVTVDQNGNLYLKVPSTHAFTLQRRAMKELAKVLPSMDMKARSRSSVFTFAPKDFAAVREALNSFSMSKAATEKIKNHFLKMAEHDLATEDENLRNYTMEAIGGFHDKYKLLKKQKQAMAWMDSRGNNGVCALGTGVGKTVTGISQMQKLVKEGYLDDPEYNGRFLYVCEAALAGNLPKEIHKFVTDGRDLANRVDILTYAKFSKAFKKNKSFADRYIAIFFDEAHKMRNPRSGYAKAALAINHPRKVLFTASPMTRDPMEAFVLAAISNNIDLNTKEGRKQTKAFRARYCEVVGGRVMGIKQDPLVKREFRVWAKRNIFYADKRDVEEVKLPEIKPQTVSVTMDPRIERLYRETAAEMGEALRGLTAKYRERETGALAKQKGLEGFRIKFAAQLRRMNDLARMPHKFVNEMTPEERAQGPLEDRLMQATCSDLDTRIDNGSRTLMHTDSPDVAEHYASTLSMKYPMKRVACCLSSRIDIYRNGRSESTYRRKAYNTEERSYTAPEWKTYVLNEVIQPDLQCMGVVLTSTYAVGQNLQAFDNTIMLDRDTFNAEVMTQRRGRNWRQGQTDPVSETTFDVVYNETTDQYDSTLDEVRKAMQQVEQDLFDSVVIESQTEALGKEVREMDWVSSYFTGLNRKLIELSVAPNPARVGQAETDGEI
tara:strand:+ start:347 stop:3412 length:3066 start_codon:yes stop_codon:yes gene_type:complete